jgi:hypothetical protein
MGKEHVSMYVCYLARTATEGTCGMSEFPSREGFSAVEEEEPVLMMGGRKKGRPQTTTKPYMDLEHTAGLLGCFLPFFLPSQLSSLHPMCETLKRNLPCTVIERARRARRTM